MWTTCLVFYQVALLGGYFYANAMVTRLRPSAQATVHCTLLVAALAFLPAIPGDRWKLSAAGIRLEHSAPAAVRSGPAVFRFVRDQPVAPSLVRSAMDRSLPVVRALERRRADGSDRVSHFDRAEGCNPKQDVLWSAGFVVFAVLCASDRMDRPRAVVRCGTCMQSRPAA